ncbi:MAG: restriction endonuclease [Ignavibacteria bacterium]|nr:restriction endonuclease [Ignavibacteria bacterium]
MAIPDYQTIMLPLLKLCNDNKEHDIQEAVENLARGFKLNDEEISELLPSGQQTIFLNRVAWARTYLKHAGLISSPRRGVFIITERGKKLLSLNPDKIDNKTLSQYEEFRIFKSRKKKDSIEEDNTTIQSNTPEEQFESAYENLRNELANELIHQLKNCNPSLFEKIVVEVLVKMGYGGSLKDAGKAIGKTGDEGIDGIIKEDKLGLDIIYVQAKRWKDNVGRPDVQKFAGALQGQRAKKGIMITTSNFSKDAVEYVSKIDSKIILIDGEQLVDYMIDFNVGVNSTNVFEIKKVDNDYFFED